MNREEVIRKAIFKPLVFLYLAALGVISFFSFTSFHSRLHSKISKANEYMTLFKKKECSLFANNIVLMLGTVLGIWITECLIWAGVVQPQLLLVRYMQKCPSQQCQCGGKSPYFIPSPIQMKPAPHFHVSSISRRCIFLLHVIWLKATPKRKRQMYASYSKECYQPFHLLVNLFWEVNCEDTLYKC